MMEEGICKNNAYHNPQELSTFKEIAATVTQMII